MRKIDTETAEYIDSLVNALTLEEKVSMAVGIDNWNTRAIERLGIPSIKMTDGPHGARTMDSAGRTLPGTCYPTGSALAATWNTELVNRVGAAIGEEARTNGCSILLGPCVNIQRSPLAGRNFESYSEDPFLSSRMTVAHITGVQSRGVATCVKHYALNNSEYQRFTISSEADERTIREIYWPSFEAAIKEAGSLSIMSSYNRVNGASSSENKLLLTDILKKEWGFEGPVVSDWWGTYSTVPAANAGLDIEMPGPARFFGAPLLAAVRNGDVPIEKIDDKVRRLLTLMAKLDVLKAGRYATGKSSDTPGHRALAREAAREAIVLLKNENGALPLNRRRIKTIAVIGPNAEMPCAEGGGSSHVRPFYIISPLQAIRERCGPGVTVVHEPGCQNNRYTAPIVAADFRSGSGKENGLLGEYFTSDDLAGEPFLRRVDSALSFTFVTAAGVGQQPDINATQSARWTGRLVARYSGAYTIGVATDGLARVYIDGKPVIDAWDARTETESDRAELKVQFVVVKGRSYGIRIEYRANPAWRRPLRRLRFGCDPPESVDLIGRAVEVARSADVAVVVAGVNEEWESEGFDRVNMELPLRQSELIRRVAAVNPRTVVVLNNGSPLAMDWLQDVPAVLEGWLGGQEFGHAVADVLFGVVNPSGRLAMTFPVRIEDNPAFINYPGENGKVLYGEGIHAGYRYYDAKKIAPLFPFGYGLSYTTFEYGNLRISPRRAPAGRPVTVSVDVSNTGKRAGKEVVQVYVSDLASSLRRPPQELKGFQKVLLKPGEKKKVSVELDGRAFSFWDPGKQAWVAEPGDFEIRVGASSRDIRAAATYTIE